ncbi:MAG TPA: hypothetical protein VJB14_12910 [Planctomycetota bacterium]|nr:hypothetical protein [Planctomycetota bacterium]
MPRKEHVTSTARTRARADLDRLYGQYRLRAGLLRLDEDIAVPPAMELLNRALEAGLPDPMPEEFRPEPIRQSWPVNDLLDLLARATFHRACDASRPQRVRDAALVFLSGVVGLHHPRTAEHKTSLRDQETHHILGGDWGKPRAWLKAALQADGYSAGPLRFAVDVRDGRLDPVHGAAEFDRQLRDSLGAESPEPGRTRRTMRTARRSRSP